MYRITPMQLLAMALLTALAAAPAWADTIANIEAQSSGTAATLNTNTLVTAILSVPGTTTVQIGGTNVSSTYSNWAILANDGTGSIEIFASTNALTGAFGYTPHVGDMISLGGTYSPFHQIPELAAPFTTNSLTLFSTNNPVAPLPVVNIPSANVNPLNPSVAAQYVALNFVTLSGFTTNTFAKGTLTGTVTDNNGNSMVLFYWPTSYSTAFANLGGTTIPSSPVNMTGFVSVFNSTPEFSPITISAPTPPAQNGSTFLISTDGGATTGKSATVSLGRVVTGVSLDTGAVVVNNTTQDGLAYPSSSFNTIIGVQPGAVAAGTNSRITVSIASAAALGVALTNQVNQIQDYNNTNDKPVSLTISAVPVQPRFVNNGGTAAIGSANDFGRMLVGSTTTMTAELTQGFGTANTINDLTTNSLTAVRLASTTQSSTSALGILTIGAGAQVDFIDTNGFTSRDLTLTAIKSNYQSSAPFYTFYNVNLINIDTALGAGDTNGNATTPGRVYTYGVYYAAANPTGAFTSTNNLTGAVTFTNPLPTDNTNGFGLRAGARITSLSPTFDQTGWTTTDGGLNANTILDYTTGTSGNRTNASTATGGVQFSTNGHLNGTYTATLSLNMEHADQTIYGTTNGDLGVKTATVQALVTTADSNGAGAYSLDGGTFTDPGSTTLTGSYNQTGGAASFGKITGGGSVTISGGTAQIRSGSGVSVLGGLTVDGGGQLDMKDNSVVVSAGVIPALGGGGSGNAALLAIRAAIKAGRDGGKWDQPGIVTSLSDTNTPAGAGKTKTLGYALGSDTNLAISTIGGQAIGPNDVVVKYTYVGDANMDGSVDGLDIAKWAVNFTGALGLGPTDAPAKLWTQGDWNFDGSVDGLDAAIWATNFTGALGGGGLAGLVVDVGPGAGANPAAVALLEGVGITVVPEPASLALLGLGGLVILGRRERRRK